MWIVDRSNCPHDLRGAVPAARGRKNSPTIRACAIHDGLTGLGGTMIRMAVVLACVGTLVACASAPAARDARDPSRPAAVFSHIEIGGGY